ncbi:MAG: amidohydrolase family protein [Synergistaceae bacterium]|nr:amidohydrolase family protein [Synergistaceae bacterium]
MAYLILKNVTLFDGTGSDPKSGMNLIVEGDRIVDVTASRKSPSALDTEIDCKGKVMLPGLIDAHMHIGLINPQMSEVVRNNHPGLMAAKMFRNLKDAIEQGFTTARDCGGADKGFKIAVEKGMVPGCRLIVCGPVLCQTGGHADDRMAAEDRPHTPGRIGFTGYVCNGVPEVQKGARDVLRQGSDFIKIMAGGGCASPTDPPTTSQYSPEELRAIVFEAESAETYVAAHCYSNRSIRLCADAGVKTIEHGNLMDLETAKFAASKGSALIPTLPAYEMMYRLADEWGLPDYVRVKVDVVREAGLNAIKNAMETGMAIGLGTDLPNERHIYCGVALEQQAKVQGELGALISATKTNAEILGISDRLGTVEPGKLADMILVSGDPFSDISLFNNYNDNILMIIKGGEVYKNII